MDPPTKAQIEGVFNKLCKGSDTLDKKQFTLLCYEFYMTPTDKSLGDAFKTLDKNTDDKLTIEEAVGLIELEWAPISKRKQEFAESIRTCRKDKTGLIDRDELRTLLMNGSDEALTEEDFEYCFAKLDIDKDGKLSEEELANILFKVDALSRQVSKISRREKSEFIELKKTERENRSRSRSRSSSRGRKGSGKKGKKDRSRSRSSSNEKKRSERKEKERSTSRSSSRGRKRSGKKEKKNRSRSRSSSNESKKSEKSCKSSKSSRSGSGEAKKDETNQEDNTNKESEGNQEDNTNKESEGNQEQAGDQTKEIEQDAAGNQEKEQTNDAQAESNKDDAGGEQTDASNIPMTVTGL